MQVGVDQARQHPGALGVDALGAVGGLDLGSDRCDAAALDEHVGVLEDRLGGDHASPGDEGGTGHQPLLS
ncbi:hypothetical protein D3C86_2040020 [compost metagenome]